MQYRQFGKIGKVSALGFGCMRLPMKGSGKEETVDEELAIPMLRRGYELGINYFDTAVGYCNERSQYTVGKAVKPFRDKIILSTKCPLNENAKSGYVRRLCEQSLERLDTPYLDVYHFHGINQGTFDDLIVPQKFMDEARQLLDEGLIKHISFSFHDKPEAMRHIIDRGEIFSSVLCQYNLLDRANEESIAYAHEKGMGVVIMGPVGGGRLGGPSSMYEKLLGVKSDATPELALRFVLGNPNVSCALSGMRNMDMLEQNVATASAEVPMTAEDFEKVGVMLEEIKKFTDLYCTGCEYCMPCPKGINISGIFKAYNMHNVYGLTDVAKDNYRRIASKHESGTASGACVNCRACMKKCPQHLEIPELLKKVEKTLA